MPGVVTEIRTEQLIWRTDVYLQERTRAKELYVRYGRKAAAAIRELGYPSHVQLMAWHKEWETGKGSLAEAQPCGATAQGRSAPL